MHEPQEPTLDGYGAETHPAFGVIAVSRVEISPPGVALFDSDILHRRIMRVRIGSMTRRRDLKHDWLHADHESRYVDVDMSEAQWASFVSSPNTSGVACTVRGTETNHDVPGLHYAPRLAESMRETRQAADEAFGEIKEARDAYEALLADKTATAKAKREALSVLHYKIENATANVTFAAKSLSKHAENVVQRARADIEAMVERHAEQIGLEAAPTSQVFALEATPEG